MSFTFFCILTLFSFCLFVCLFDQNKYRNNTMSYIHFVVYTTKKLIQSEWEKKYPEINKIKTKEFVWVYLKQLKILFSRKSKKKKPFVFNTTTILFTISIKPLVNQSDPIEIIVTNRINQSILEKKITEIQREKEHFWTNYQKNAIRICRCCCLNQTTVTIMTSRIWQIEKKYQKESNNSWWSLSLSSSSLQLKQRITARRESFSFESNSFSFFFCCYHFSWRVFLSISIVVVVVIVVYIWKLSTGTKKQNFHLRYLSSMMMKIMKSKMYPVHLSLCIRHVYYSHIHLYHLKMEFWNAHTHTHTLNSLEYILYMKHLRNSMKTHDIKKEESGIKKNFLFFFASSIMSWISPKKQQQRRIASSRLQWWWTWWSSFYSQ